MCDLTYREARAYLLPHIETQEELSEDLGITKGSVKNLRRRAAWKVQSSGFTLSEIVGRYGQAFNDLIEMPYTEPDGNSEHVISVADAVPHVSTEL